VLVSGFWRTPFSVWHSKTCRCSAGLAVNVYEFLVTPPLVVEVASKTTLSLNHFTVGVGSPPVDEHVMVTESPFLITAGPVIIGGPAGATINKESTKIKQNNNTFQ
jgi:hypothetical protein